MVNVAQLVEPRIVVPVVVGSSPIVHPILLCYFISGPSGVGKGTLIIQVITQKQLSLAISATTRQPREGEHHGHDYYFLSDREFDDHISSDNFLEWCACPSPSLWHLKI